VLGWLRLLSEWVGRDGEVVGSDVADNFLAAAQSFVEQERLSNVTLVHDDLFNSRLSPQSFDLVHARFMLGPLGRAAEQLASYHRLSSRAGGLS
jgi:ubiquinone/menaquinone biosynthesis C-methylase UbiE